MGKRLFFGAGVLMLTLAMTVLPAGADRGIQKEVNTTSRPVEGCASTIWLGNNEATGRQGLNTHPAIVFLMGYTARQDIHSANYYYRYLGWDFVWYRSRTVPASDLQTHLDVMFPSLPPGTLFEVRADHEVIANTAC